MNMPEPPPDISQQLPAALLDQLPHGLGVVVPEVGSPKRAARERELLERVRQLDAEREGRLTLLDFCRITGVSESTIHRWFGGWNGLRARAGLARPRRIGCGASYSAQTLIEKLRALQATGRRLNEREFCEQARVSPSTIQRYCGGWRHLCAAAGMKPPPPPGPSFRMIDLCLDLHGLVCLLCRFPTLEDIDQHARYPAEVHLRAFGSYEAMCQQYEQFGEWMRNLLADQPDEDLPAMSPASSSGPLSPVRGGEG